MLNNATGFRKIYIAAGYTDLQRGIDGLASIVKYNFQLDPYEKDILFLFCGRRSDRMKGLVWEGDGKACFIVCYYKAFMDMFCSYHPDIRDSPWIPYVAETWQLNVRSALCWWLSFQFEKGKPHIWQQSRHNMKLYKALTVVSWVSSGNLQSVHDLIAQ